MNQQERRIYLIREMQREMPQYADIPIPEEEMQQRRLLRSLFNLRPPYPASEDFLNVQDAYLSEVIRERGIVEAADLPSVKASPRISLWQGDITTLYCDAIVNAANSALLGCWQPCHSCIDNIIHSLSGVQLRRQDCETLADCYRSCLELAASNGVQSIAFCCISTGVFHFPQESAAEIATETVLRFLETDTSIRQVIFNVFTDRDRNIYRNLLEG